MGNYFTIIAGQLPTSGDVIKNSNSVLAKLITEAKALYTLTNAKAGLGHMNDTLAAAPLHQKTPAPAAE